LLTLGEPGERNRFDLDLDLELGRASEPTSTLVSAGYGSLNHRPRNLIASSWHSC
jgi:hypothetical protein